MELGIFVHDNHGDGKVPCSDWNCLERGISTSITSTKSKVRFDCISRPSAKLRSWYDSIVQLVHGRTEADSLSLSLSKAIRHGQQGNHVSCLVPCCRLGAEKALSRH
jgi:hypothetical protein